MLINSTKEKLFPEVIEYQPYAICNANCVYCPVGMLNRQQNQKGETIKEEVFEAMLEHTKGRLLERISPHLNCEPLLCKNLPEQIERWKEEHPEAQVEFSTNGVFLNEKIFTRLVESGLDLLDVHYMGVSKEYHEKAMQTKYDRVKKNLENVLKLKDKNHYPITINISCHRLAGASISDWYEFGQEWKSKGAIVMLGPLWNRAGYYGDKFDDISVGIRSDSPSPCIKPFQQIAIEHDGRVVLCSLDYNHQVKIGNIMEQSIEEIWNGPMMTHYQEGQKELAKLKKLTLCKDCIRGGRYLLDEQFLSRLMNYEIPETLPKEEFQNYLTTLDKF